MLRLHAGSSKPAYAMRLVEEHCRFERLLGSAWQLANGLAPPGARASFCGRLPDLACRRLLDLPSLDRLLSVGYPRPGSFALLQGHGQAPDRHPRQSFTVALCVVYKIHLVELRVASLARRHQPGGPPGSQGVECRRGHPRGCSASTRPA